MSEQIKQVGAIDLTKANSAIVSSDEHSSLRDGNLQCSFNGEQYSLGSVICSAGTKLICSASATGDHAFWKYDGKCDG